MSGDPGRDGALAVAIDVSAVPARPAGAGRYALELAGALARRGDCRVTLLTRQNDDGRLRRLAPRARLLPVVPSPRLARLLYERYSLGRFVGSIRGPSIACYHGPHYTLPRRLARPAVVTVHDLTFLEHPEWHERSKVAVFSSALRYGAEHAAVSVCVSEQTAARYRELCSPAGAVVVIPHGVDHGRFTPDEPVPDGDATCRRELGVAGRYLLHLGTLEPRKGVEDLVSAFGRLAADDGELELVLAGATGWGTAALEAAVAACPARDRIRRLGYVSDEAVTALLRGAAAVVYPSYEEGFGLPALEALACGAPLVTTTGTVMAELAGEAARLVEPGDPEALAAAAAAVLAEAAEGPERAARRSAGLAVAARYTWEQCAAAHLGAYRLAVSR